MKRLGTLRLDLIALSVFLVLVIARFWHLISRINSILFHQYGDGAKNYFTTAYYVRYDSGWVFDGMNYPYGEILPFTDNQPLLSLLLNFIDDNIYSLSSHTIGIINSMMLLSFALCAFFSYKILRHYDCSWGFAIWGGIIVSFLAPQIDRMAVHFALGYSFFIPLTWWIILNLKAARKPVTWSMILGINIVSQAFIHPYYLLISGIFILSFFVANALIHWKIKAFIPERGWYMMISLLSAGILVMGIMKSTDPVTDRPSDPYGINAYVTDLASVFLPGDGPLNEWLSPKTTWEGQAYIGLMGGFLLILILLKGIRHIRQHESWKTDRTRIGEWAIFLTAGWVTFLYASGWLNQLGLSYLNEFIPPLKQFRSLGRLAWITYYTTVIGTMIFLYRYIFLNESLKRTNRTWLTVLVLLVWTVEAHFHSTALTRDFEDHNVFGDLTSFEPELESLGINDSVYQAILSLPLQVFGPEKIEIKRGSEVLRQAMVYALHTGLPIMDIMMSRTSLSQAMDLVELLSPSYVKKGRLDSMDNRPILILADETQLTEEEKALFDQAKPIGQINGLSLRSLDPDTLYQPLTRDSISELQPPLIHFGLNDGAQPGFVASAHLVEDHYQLWLGTVPTDEVYEASFWLDATSMKGSWPVIQFTKLDPGGAIMWQGNFDFREDILVQDDWLRISRRFDGFPDYDIFKIEIDGNNIVIDEFEVRKWSEPSSHSSGTVDMINNYKLYE
ncbi:MAG: hypothetical protein R3275_10800 [Saprospiraceae bacterium]|nr:hypothetical protein [Saprospiraceae bacterium]